MFQSQYGHFFLLWRNVSTKQVGDLPKLQGVDELNFAEFPLALISTAAAEEVSELSFEDEIDDEGTGRRVRRKLVIEAPPHIGLPLPRDADVLLVLARHALRSDEEVLRRVSFRRRDFLGILGWDDSGQSYRRLDESLRRWTSVTLHYTNAWWDKSRQRWRTRTFHVLDEIELSGGQAEGGAEHDALCSFTWGDTVYQSLRARNVRSIDLDQYFRLTRAASRQAYRFLGKRFWFKKRLQFDLRTFCCEHLGFSRKYDIGGLKRAVLPVLDELASIGFIEPLRAKDRFHKVRAGNWEIVILAKGEGSGEKLPCSTISPAILKAHGVNDKVAERLARDFDETRIRRNIAVLERILARPDRGGIRKPAGFLVTAIERDFARRGLEKAHVAPARKSAPQATVGDRSTATPRRPDPLVQTKTHLAALSVAERQALENSAVAACGSFHREALSRLESQGGPLLEELKLKLISDYLQDTDRKC